MFLLLSQDNQSKANPCALGSYLSLVDPWYNSNIKGLGSMIPKLAEMVRLTLPGCVSLRCCVSTRHW